MRSGTPGRIEQSQVGRIPKSAFQNEALCRRDALRGALLRPRSPRYVPYRQAPCVLASHSRITPRRRTVILKRALNRSIISLVYRGADVETHARSTSANCCRHCVRNHVRSDCAQFQPPARCVSSVGRFKRGSSLQRRSRTVRNRRARCPGARHGDDRAHAQPASRRQGRSRPDRTSTSNRRVGEHRSTWPGASHADLDS